MARTFFAIAGLSLLSACAETVWAPEEEVQRALYQAEGPPKLTLYTVERVSDGGGAHSALMVSGPHRALFDPAGTFKHPKAPERNDVIFGMKDDVVSVYVDYHARETYNVRIQEVTVSPDVASRALLAIQEHGAVPKAHCNIAVTRILSGLPGFQSVPRGYAPGRTARWFGQLPGVTEELVTDDDADDNHGVLIQAMEKDIYQPPDR